MSMPPLVKLCGSVAIATAVLVAGGGFSTAGDKVLPGPKTEDKAPKAKSAPADKAPAAEVTLKGEMTCAKCGLHETKACQNVLRVKETGTAGKETKYYLTKNDVSEEQHEKVCSGSSPATVTGKVGEDHGKKTIAPSAIKFD